MDDTPPVTICLTNASSPLPGGDPSDDQLDTTLVSPPSVSETLSIHTLPTMSPSATPMIRLSSVSPICPHYWSCSDVVIACKFYPTA
jgi:hypothetical protein